MTQRERQCCRYGSIYSIDALLQKTVAVCDPEHVRMLLAAEHDLVGCECAPPCVGRCASYSRQLLMTAVASASSLLVYMSVVVRTASGPGLLPAEGQQGRRTANDFIHAP